MSPHPTPRRATVLALAVVITATHLAVGNHAPAADAAPPEPLIETIRSGWAITSFVVEEDDSIVMALITAGGGGQVIRYRYRPGPGGGWSDEPLLTDLGCFITGDFLQYGERCWLGPVASSGDGTVFVRSLSDAKIYRIPSEGQVSVYAGGGRSGLGDGGQAVDAQIRYDNRVPILSSSSFRFGMDVGPGGLYLTDGARVRRVDSSGIITTVAGTGVRGSSGDGGPATEAQIGWANDVVAAPDGSLYIATSDGTTHQEIRLVDPEGRISTIAGGAQGYAGDGGPAVDAQFMQPADLALSPDGGLYVADATDGYARVRHIYESGMIDTVAGTGIPGYSGDGGPAIIAQVTEHAHVGVHPILGVLYISEDCGCDGTSDRAGLRRVTTLGLLAGTARQPDGVSGASGVTVTLMVWPGWAPVATTRTDTDGSYAFGGIPAGTYRVRFFDGQGRYGRQWFQSKSSFVAADDVVVPVAGSATADQTLTAATGSLTGVVRDATSAPIAGVWVQAFDSTGYVAGKVTGPYGGYGLNGLPAGAYWLRFVHPDGRAWWYPGTPTKPDAAPTTIAATPTTADLTFDP